MALCVTLITAFEQPVDTEGLEASTPAGGNKASKAIFRPVRGSQYIKGR